jgi:hypothetical protein
LSEPKEGSVAGFLIRSATSIQGWKIGWKIGDPSGIVPDFLPGISQ